MRMSFSWGTGITLVYTLFAAATAGFAAFAMGRPVELVSADYYQRSLQQDERLAAERNAIAAGDDLSIRQESPEMAVLALPAADAGAARGTVTLYRPSDSRADRQRPLQVDSAGRQRIPLAGLAHGRWVIQARWSAGGRDYYVERGIDVR